jgi:hypothetical protein
MSELIPADAAVSPWRASAERVTKGEGVASGTRWRISGGTPGPRFWMRPERRSASPHRCKTAILRAAGRTPTPVEVEGDVLKCPDWIYSHCELEIAPGALLSDLVTSRIRADPTS